MDKETFFKSFQDSIIEISQKASAKLARAILLIMKDMDTEGGALVKTKKNLSLISKVIKLIRDYFTDRANILSKYLFDKIEELISINETYFNSIKKASQNLEIKGIKSYILELIGVSTTGKATKGGQIATMLSDNRVSKVVITLIADSLKRGDTIKDLLNKIKDTFAPKLGLGINERQLSRQGGFDFLQRTDREISLKMASDLGLRHALYSGTIKDSTRDFCRARVNRIYTKAEIKKWDSLKWNGKKKDQNSLLDCGGWACRHHLNYITEEEAQRLAKARNKPINSYN